MPDAAASSPAPIRDGHGTRSGADQIRSPVTFFGSGFGFEFSGKSRIRIRYQWYGVYRMYLKAWQRRGKAGSGVKNLEANRIRSQYFSDSDHLWLLRHCIYMKNSILQKVKFYCILWYNFQCIVLLHIALL